MMLRFNQSYGYSKKYQDLGSVNQNLVQHRQQINDKTKKLCIENKKRRRQFEERQRIHERNEQKRREEALNSRRRRQQEATNAYKAALSKELNKRNKTPSSRISSASSIGSQSTISRGRHIYRSPTVDEVLSNIRGHALGGSLRTYGETSNASPLRTYSEASSTPSRPPSASPLRTYSEPANIPSRPPTSSSNYTAVSNYTSPTYMKHVLSFNSPASRDTEYHAKVRGAPESRGARDVVVERAEARQEMVAGLSKQISCERGDVRDIVADSLETGDFTARLESTLAHYSTGVRESERENERENDPDRIRVQIDLTKFDQLEVSDCESIDDPPIDPTVADTYRTPTRPSADKHIESYSDLSKLVPQPKTSPIQHLQSEGVASRAANYFGPPDHVFYSTPLTALRTSTSEPNVNGSPKSENLPKSSSHIDLSTEQPNYSIQSSDGESFIYANSPVEAVKAASAASRTTAWTTASSSASDSAEQQKKHLKSLIKRTPSARRKQVRWDSVSALDDETMEVDQFDISTEGEAVFTRQYSHPTPARPVSATMYRDQLYDDTDLINLQRTPTDAEINALWNKVRTTLHRNQAWDSPQSKTALPHRPPVSSYNRRSEAAKAATQDSLRIYTNVVVDNDRYKLNKRSAKSPGQSAYGPSIAKMTEFSENGHTLLSMEEQRILQSLERLDAKLKDNGVYETNEPKTQIVTFSSPSLEISRPPVRGDTYKRLLNRKTNGLSSKYR